MAINDKLRFSWGHIMAFVAMIFISYVSFMGLTYLTDGNFLYAGLGVFIIILILSFFFIGVQMLKATDTKFRTRIKWERLFFVLTFAAFLLVMVPYSHFWIVFDKRQQVEETFSNSVQTTKGSLPLTKRMPKIELTTTEKNSYKMMWNHITVTIW